MDFQKAKDTPESVDSGDTDYGRSPSSDERMPGSVGFHHGSRGGYPSSSSSYAGNNNNNNNGDYDDDSNDDGRHRKLTNW